MEVYVPHENISKLRDDLCEFASRVAKDKNAKPAELEILPEIARIIFRMESDL